MTRSPRHSGVAGFGLSGDHLVAGSLALLGAATLGVTTWIAYRSGGALLDALRRPLSPTQTEALWTGLVAANLMLLQVVLLARLPWIERAWGRGVITRCHAVLGFASFWLMVTHVVLFAQQRAARRPADIGSALLDLFVREQHMLIATIGTVLVLVVTLSSMSGLRRRIRYEVWHLVHLWSYLAIGLVLPHELVSVDFVDGWTTTYWWTLHLVPLCLVLVWRVGRPVHVTLRHRLRVEQRVEETPGVVSLVMSGRALSRLPVSSGQFFLWRFSGPGWTRAHPYSLSRAPAPDTLRVTIGGTGDGAAAARRVQVGSAVAVEGPYGSLAPLRRRHPHLLLMAAGMGITPFRAILEDSDVEPGEVTLIHRARSEAERLFADEIAVLAAQRGVRVVPLLGPRQEEWSFLPRSEVGTIDEPPDRALVRLAPDLLSSDVYLCGPPRWTWGATQAARAAGVRRRDVHREEFGW
ncbi:MAG: ferredoxin reductase family protein [Nocardioides sp.]|uniref:ferredoxin reductase family protein n=1 Tax=Nocardioides sp. TaxID=35761 RepID=UPI0023921A53|nr:ferredoxin reductase family protein [Nocardioides sp.]MDE0777025.1 ferredoxin reductase family protein [Nocardioides sp.]